MQLCDNPFRSSSLNFLPVLIAGCYMATKKLARYQDLLLSTVKLYYSEKYEISYSKITKNDCPDRKERTYNYIIYETFQQFCILQIVFELFVVQQPL